MKNLLLLSLITFTCSLFAQDTILLVNGERIPALVKNVGPSEIEYKKASNPDGPSYVSAKKDVKAIHYRNGTSDEFSTSAAVSSGNDDYYGAPSTTPVAAATSMNMSMVKAAPAIVFYGLDFTNFSLLEAKRINEGAQIRDLFPEWNMYF